MKIFAEKAVFFLGDRDGAALEAEEMRHLAIQRCLEIVGEAAGRVPSFVEAALPAIPFKDAASMRHRIVHGYATVNADRVAETVRVHLPPMITALAEPLPDER
ncbi:MAG: HepT-like ribonuclease domain-containing protein [Oceanicaulis sp.]